MLANLANLWSHSSSYIAESTDNVTSNLNLIVTGMVNILAQY